MDTAPSTGPDMSMSIESSTGSGCGASGTHNMTHASETEIRVENIARNWTVRNFSHCYQEYLENFVHLPRGEETLTWSIKIYPKGNGENNKDFVFLCLNRVLNTPGGSSNSPKNKIGFKSRFVLRNSENKEIDMRIHPNPSHSDYVSYIKRDVLFPQIMPADSITVTVEIACAFDTVTTTVDEPIQSIDFEKKLGDDFLRLFEASESHSTLSDFTIKVGNDRQIYTHKAILAARSPVFAAMFTHTDTKEAKEGILNIEDTEFDVIKEMVVYIYSGKCSSNHKELASELLVAADKYRLDELKSHCESTLIQEIAVDNVCQLFVVGHIYNAERLKQRAADFIKLQLTAVTNTSGWDEFIKSHPTLVTGIIRYVDKSGTAEDIANISRFS
ncbi:hypothetical protein L596_020505 [Steinernema carpocapsae]|uniref:BTB domain-containing protein n=1 Tax=Steinernema carpocapsae TaxID=34508 RepID=A0A4U5MTY0_STECR|nr:hypothetical protein L596_020505 [Steinernema carpocapsae]